MEGPRTMSGPIPADSGARRPDRPGIVTRVGISELTGSPAERTALLLRRQAEACRDIGSPLYGDLLEHAAADLLAGGPVADVLRGHLDTRPSSVLALRLLGGAHALALAGRAPELAQWYPSAGGIADAQPG